MKVVRFQILYTTPSGNQSFHFYGQRKSALTSVFSESFSLYARQSKYRTTIAQFQLSFQAVAQRSLLHGYFRVLPRCAQTQYHRRRKTSGKEIIATFWILLAVDKLKLRVSTYCMPSTYLHFLCWANVIPACILDVPFSLQFVHVQKVLSILRKMDPKRFERRAEDTTWWSGCDRRRHLKIRCA